MTTARISAISPGSSRRLASRRMPGPGSQVAERFQSVIAPDPQCVDDTMILHSWMSGDRTRGEQQE